MPSLPSGAARSEQVRQDPSRAAARPVRKQSRAKLWLLIHGWLALPLWAFIFFVCLTGTIATVSHELVWLFDSDVRASRAEGEERLSADRLAARVLEQRPGAVLQSISWPVESHFAPSVGIARPDGSEVTLYVNPYSGEVQGEASTVDFRYFTRALHGWLFLPFSPGWSWGWYLVSALSIPMLGSLVTGILVYKKFWRAYLNPRLRWGKGARTFWGDFHRLAGIWSLPFIFIIAISALWFLIEGILFDMGVTLSTAGVPPVVAREDVPAVESAALVGRIGLDAAIAAVAEVHPGMEPSFLSTPSNAYGHIGVSGRGVWPLVFDSAAVNPYTGAVDQLRTVGDMSGVELVTESMRPLHTGDFMGLWLKVIYFVFGVLLTMMVLSGMLIWTKRTARATADYVREGRRPAPLANPAALAKHAALAKPAALTEPAE